MLLRLTLIEDNKYEQAHWLKLMEQWSNNHSIPICTYVYSSADELLSSNENWSTSHVLFLDIDLPVTTGIELARTLRQRKINSDLIFLTAHSEYVFDGYSVEALDFLLKPLHENALDQCLKRVLDKYNSGYYTFRTNTTIIQLPYSDILYFSSYRHYTEIFTSSKKYTHRINLNDILQVLPAQFIQIHRTTIINIHHVFSLNGTTLIMDNRESLPVSRSYVKDLKSRLIRHNFYE